MALRQRLQRTSNRRLLIVRDEPGLQALLSECRELRELLLNDTRVETPQEWVAAVETRNLIDVAELMATAALARRESRGSHYREDFPQSDPAHAHNIVLDQVHPQGYFKARLGELDFPTPGQPRTGSH